MAKSGARAPRILVVEDEYLLADDIRDALSAAGSATIGPFSSIGEVLQLLAQDHDIDGAVLDINLKGSFLTCK